MLPDFAILAAYVAFAVLVAAEYGLARLRGERPDRLTAWFALSAVVVFVSCGVLAYPGGRVHDGPHGWAHALVAWSFVGFAWRSRFFKTAFAVRDTLAQVEGALGLADSERAAVAALVSAVVASDEAALSAGVLPADRRVHLTRVVFMRGGALRPVGKRDDEMVGAVLGHYATPEFVDAAREAATNREGQSSLTTRFPDTEGRVRTYRTIVVRASDEAARMHHGVGPGETLLVWFWIDVSEIGDALAEKEEAAHRARRMADTLTRVHESVGRLPDDPRSSRAGVAATDG